MKDMTKGPVAGHVLQLAGFIALTMLFQTLYFLADLYFVGRLGKEAVAGVSLSGNLAFVVLALTQSLGVGATALVAQALGRRQREQAELVFNQAFVLSALTGLAFGLFAFAARRAYCGWLAADAATAEQGIRYLTWFVPALAMQFLLVAMSATLRGMGDLKVPTAIQVATVILNVVLAPVLIFGWLGAPGARRARCGDRLARRDHGGLRGVRPLLPARAEPLPLPPLAVAPAAAALGRPAPDRAAGGRGVRPPLLLHAADLRHLAPLRRVGPGRVRHRAARDAVACSSPVVAVAFATAPVVGQNFGARLGPRVREAFRAAAQIGAGVMLVLTVLCHIAPDALVRVFSRDEAVVAVRLRVPADRELELRRVGPGVRDLERLPGPRQHAARARELGAPAAAVRAAGLHALAAAGLRDAARLVSVGRLRSRCR
jgi:hypothetical protein